jgi:hypothetical protein
MPTYAATGLALLTLWKIAVAAEASATGAAWVDAFRVRTSPDTLCFHSHNICPAVTVLWKASATGVFGGEEVTLATLTVAEHRFYVHLSAPSDLPYHRVVFSGTNYDARKGGPMIWLGELGLGQAVSLSPPRQDWDETPTLAPVADVEQYTITPSWFWRTDARYQLWLQELLARAQFGRASNCYPLWLIPRSEEPRCYFCRPSPAKISRIFSGIRQATTVTFEEEPHPLWV